MFFPRNRVTRGFRSSIDRVSRPLPPLDPLRLNNPNNLHFSRGKFLSSSLSLSFFRALRRLVCKLGGGEESTWLFIRFAGAFFLALKFFIRIRAFRIVREKVFNVFRAKARGEGRRESKRSTETTRCLQFLESQRSQGEKFAANERCCMSLPVRNIRCSKRFPFCFLSLFLSSRSFESV